MAATPLPVTSPPPPPHPPTAATIRSITAAGDHAAALRALSSLSAAPPSAPLDRFALPPAAKSAAALRSLPAVRAIHAAALRRRLLDGPKPAVANALLTAYARSRSRAPTSPGTRASAARRTRSPSRAAFWTATNGGVARWRRRGPRMTTSRGKERRGEKRTEERDDMWGRQSVSGVRES